MDWRANDLALCLAGQWFDKDGFPLTGFPAVGPVRGRMLTVLATRLHPDFGTADLAFPEWPGAWFDAAGFRRIPPPEETIARRAAALA